MSVKLLAAKTGTKPPHVSNYLAGRRNVSVKTLSAFLAALGLTAELVPIQASRVPQDAPQPKPAAHTTPETPARNYKKP